METISNISKTPDLIREKEILETLTYLTFSTDALTLQRVPHTNGNSLRVQFIKIDTYLPSFSRPERIELIDKPSLDPRSYKGLILSNKLKVLLIQDPAAIKKFVSLSVGVGKSRKIRAIGKRENVTLSPMFF